MKEEIGDILNNQYFLVEIKNFKKSYSLFSVYYVPHTALSLFSTLSHLYLTSLNVGNTAFIIQTFLKEEQMGKATCCWSHSLHVTDKEFNPQSRKAKPVLASHAEKVGHRE